MNYFQTVDLLDVTCFYLSSSESGDLVFYLYRRPCLDFVVLTRVCLLVIFDLFNLITIVDIQTIKQDPLLYFETIHLS